MIDEKIELIRNYFNENKFVVVKGFLDPNMAHLFYQYCINKVKKVDFLSVYAKHEYRPDWDGEFGDPQAPISYSCYGDDLMDTLLAGGTETLSQYVGVELTPTYSYWRLYQHGEELVRHRDRHSCEISATLCLGYNYDNLNGSEESYDWPMYVQDPDSPESGLPVSLDPGDIIIYRGCEVDHWRERFKGLNHAQVFLHYNNKNGDFPNPLDGRPILCIPKKYQASV